MVRQILVAALAGGLVAAPSLAQAQRRERDALRADGMTPTRGGAGTTVTLQGEFPRNAVVSIGQQRLAARAERGRRTLRFDVPQLDPGPHRVTVRAGRRQVDVGEFDVLPPLRRPAQRVGQPVAAPVPTSPVPPALVPAAVPAPQQVAVSTAQPATDVERLHVRHRSRSVVTGFHPRSGPAGTEVTIRGQRLDAGLELVLAGRTLTPSGVTPTAITFTLPRRAETGAIVLRGPRIRDITVGTFEVTSRRESAALRREHIAQLRREAEASWAERRAQVVARRETERLQALREQEQQLRRSREERRRQHVEALRARWEQAFLAQRDVRDELALHAERSARLERMLRLAEAHGDGALVVRIEILIRAEDERHQQRLSDLKAAFGAG